MRTPVGDLDEGLISLVDEYNSSICNIWESEETVVVMGRTNITEKEIYLENCIRDNVCVKRRKGGGGAVVLTKGVLIISIAKVTDPDHMSRPLKLLKEIACLIMFILKKNDVKNLSQEGTSDICIDNKKILGSSLYLPKGKIFYQASLLVDCDLTIMDKYLKYPSKEPDYRHGRSHGEFLTTLYREGYMFLKENLIKDLKGMIDVNLCSIY